MPCQVSCGEMEGGSGGEGCPCVVNQYKRVLEAMPFDTGLSAAGVLVDERALTIILSLICASFCHLLSPFTNIHI